MPVKHYLWLDLEMSGLDVEKCRILEVAAIVTDLDLNEVATFHRIVHQPAAVLEAMDSWCQNQHGKSGLTAAVPNGDPEADVEDALVAFLQTHWPSREKIILCGNSIGTDRKFIDRYWPKAAAKLHYRMVDVSSFKVVLRQRLGVAFEKKGGHRAVDDIRESIAELAHYLKHFQAKPVSSAS